MKLFVISCLVALAAAAPQQFVDQFNNQQFVSNNNQFVSDDQFINDNNQFISDNNQQFVGDFNNQQFVSDGGSQSFGGSDNGVRTVNSRFEQDQTGNFEYAYELSDGTKAEQIGRSTPGSEPETGSLSQEGSYEFVADDGNTYQVSYRADENGFQPQGAHLPQAPAQIPEYEQLRREHPELFWAENGGAGVVLNSQPQFDNQQFDNQQFDNQQFSNQQFGNQDVQVLGQFIN